MIIGVAADDHRLQLHVVDVRRDDRPTAGDFLADEFRRDLFRDARAKTVTRVLLLEQTDIRPGLGPAWVVDVGEAQFGQFRVRQALLAEVGTQTGQALGVATAVDPRRADIGQALAHVAGLYRLLVDLGRIAEVRGVF